MAEALPVAAQDNQKVESGHGTSDQLVDPWCELCILDSKKKIDAVGYCPECNTLICRSCVGFHKKWPTLKNHRIWRGSKMPKSQADKPVRYPDCKSHGGTPNDHYCIQHNKMVCSECMRQAHGNCNVMLISDICMDLGKKEIEQFRTAVVGIQEIVKSAKTKLEKNAADLEKREKDLITTAEVERDTIISKTNELFEQTVLNISAIFRVKKTEMRDEIEAFSDEIESFHEIIENIDTTDKTVAGIEQDTFIQMQQIVEKTQQCTEDIKDMISKIHIANLSFATSRDIINFWTNIKDLGYVQEELTKLEVKEVPDIKFPITFQRKLEIGTKQKDIGQVQAQKISTVNVRAPGEKHACYINGMAFCSKGVLYLTDLKNETLKLISQDRKIISYFRLDNRPKTIEVIDDSTAVVGTQDKKIHIYDISNPKNRTLSKTLCLPYRVTSIVAINGNLAVTCWGIEPMCVKLITMEGKELWSVSADEQGQQLFEKTRSMVYNTVNGEKQLVVTDWGKDTITLLDPSNGRVMKKIDVKGKAPHGLTLDKDGNVYVCYFDTKEIRVFTPDFEKNKVILTSKDLQGCPIEIVYNDKTNELFISYGKDADTVECFRLS